MTIREHYEQAAREAAKRTLGRHGGAGHDERVILEELTQAIAEAEAMERLEKTCRIHVSRFEPIASILRELDALRAATQPKCGTCGKELPLVMMADPDGGGYPARNECTDCKGGAKP